MDENPDKQLGNVLRNLRFSLKVPIGASVNQLKESKKTVLHGSKAQIQFGGKLSRKTVLVTSADNESVLRARSDVRKALQQVKISKRVPKIIEKRKKQKNVLQPFSEDYEVEEKENEDEVIVAEHERYPPQMNILVLGETGVGKSTFINGLVNYLKYESLEDAMQTGPEILIKSSFTLTDDDFNSRDIVSEPTIGIEKRHESNEHHGKGHSSTQEPRSYVFSWSTGSEERKSIRIIDTPGIGDTRGIDQDKKNFENILSFISDYSQLHAICILVKPNTARLTLAFRFCIDELLVHLHKSASKNILFCFTNTRGTLYKPGDTLPTLREHLTKLEDARGISIPLDISTLFSFDNESFRFLCACKDGFRFSDCEKENFSASWSKSVEESVRLFSRIAELPSHSVNDTLCLNNTRSVILTLARPLAEIARNQMINRQLIEDKVREISDHAKSGDDLRSKLYVEQLVLRAEELDYPQTVCTADGCVEHRRFGTNPNAPLQTVYKTVCHDKCYVKGVQTEICPNPKLQDCEAIMDDVCLECRCSWRTHLHIRYKLTETPEKVIDPSVAESLKNKDCMVKTIELFITKEREKAAELKRESDKISSYCVEFAAFLAQNSILPYNDSYRQYIDHLIRQEHDNVAAGGSDTLLREMKRYKDEYEQQVVVLNARMGDANNHSVRSVEEMNKMVEELQNLRHCGLVLTEIRNFEVRKVRETQSFFGQMIQLCKENSWFGGSGRLRKRPKNKKKRNRK